MGKKFLLLLAQCQQFDETFLEFELYRVGVKPPRVYANSPSLYYDFMRSVGLANISYLSVLKLETNTKEILFYFKIFIDYNPEILCYQHNTPKIKMPKKQVSLTQARMGQGEYRHKLLLECPFCPFTMVNDEHLLIASHIKPWIKCDDKEKIDPKNGIILTPTYDKLFDRGFISFDENKRLLLSPWLSPMNIKRLNLSENVRLLALSYPPYQCLAVLFHHRLCLYD
ncbi:HNH endonuclease [Helicobacter cetorum]|uniref:HNH endonuclease n=1 Tax=Helicobacter cetorum TaxID=138563 RepID=UPI00117DE483